MKKILKICILLGLFLGGLTSHLQAQDTEIDTTSLHGNKAILHPHPGAPDPDHNLATAAANPLANMISLPIQNNFNFNYGPNEKFQYNVNLQPVLPYRLNKNMNMINRVIIPISVNPAGSGDAVAGIGNTTWSMWVVPKPIDISKGWNLTWGAGPALSIPTASHPELGGGPFGIGATALAVFGSKQIVGGFLIGFLDSYINDDLSSIFSQYFITWNIKKGWFINTSPNISGNLNAPDGEKWIFPVGIGGGKVTTLGNQPLKWQVSYYHNLTTPDVFWDNSIQFVLTLMFPKKAK